MREDDLFQNETHWLSRFDDECIDSAKQGGDLKASFQAKFCQVVVVLDIIVFCPTPTVKSLRRRLRLPIDIGEQVQLRTDDRSVARNRDEPDKRPL